MGWDGIYRDKTHYAVKASHDHVAIAICGRRHVRHKTDKPASVSCFACLKKLGVVK